MAEVPEDYVSGPDESESLEPEGTKSPKLHDAKSDTAAEVTPEIDQEPEEDVFEEGKPGSAENVLPESARAPEEIPKETNMDLPSQIEAEITQELKLESSRGAGGEDLEVPGDEKHEPDLQPPGDVLTEPLLETDTQLPTETMVPEATSRETITKLPEKTGQKAPAQSPREGDTETGPEQNAPDFPSDKPRKSVEEEDLAPSKMTESEITAKTQGESAEEKSTEPTEVATPDLPGEMLRKSTEEAATEPPEEVRMKSIQQPEQTKPELPDTKPRLSIKDNFPELMKKLMLDLSDEEFKEPSEKASLELSEKATSKETRKSSVEEKISETLEEAALGLPKEIKPDVQGKTQEKSAEEKVPEPSEDRKPTGQKEKPGKSSEKSKSKGTLVESSKEKGPVFQGQTEAELPKKKLKISNEETGQMPPQMTKPEPTKEPKLANEPKPRETPTELPKEHRPETSKFKSPVGMDKEVSPGYHKKMPEKETSKTKNEFMVGSPEESVESGGDFESHKPFRETQPNVCEVITMVPSSESLDSVSEKVVDLPQGLGCKEPKVKKSARPQFEHLKWSPEEVAEWIGELGFPQYKECFTENFISGPKLIYVNCCNLPQMGITDFEDMKTISRHTRELLGIEEPLFSRSISLPYRDNIGLFLEQKGHSGVQSASLTFSEFVKAAGLPDCGLEIDDIEKDMSSLLDSCQEENEFTI
ncbi:sterile alpha motif domain-containing protein 15 isoform X1 [Cricetulus griseus]|uniref:Sterile alpha motif domain-containing protein 15 isoform X1 n=1 Tax=Cricetulus griseus TaxID=10029 RepID=A0A9J7G224_CRIGR|nr:sterile alpha motif domain-containing protein 15 isoform X1 [Cricetulus griseus]XP_027274411.1 sterile alpha motif domain-containing protein 15 isoform X1 [Cricetulus griseus]